MSVSLLLAAFAASAAHPHPSPPPVVEPARARANLASYVGDSDYPASALRERAEGTTGFTLSVGADGRVTGCTVTASSGSAALDNASCSLMRRRARFTPARDASGQPASDTVDSRLVWRLPTLRAAPAEAPAPAMTVANSPEPVPPRIVTSPPVPTAAPAPAPMPPRPVEPARARANLASYVSVSDYPASALRERAEGTTGFTLTVGPDGRVTGCTVTASSGNAALDNASCSIMRRRARFTPARDSNGQPASDTVRSRLVWHLPATPPPAAAAAPMPAESATPSAEAAPLRLLVTVSPAGEITGCRVLARDPSELGERTCAAISERARSRGEAADGGR